MAEIPDAQHGGHAQGYWRLSLETIPSVLGRATCPAFLLWAGPVRLRPVPPFGVAATSPRSRISPDSAIARVARCGSGGIFPCGRAFLSRRYRAGLPSFRPRSESGFRPTPVPEALGKKGIRSTTNATMRANKRRGTKTPPGFPPSMRQLSCRSSTTRARSSIRYGPPSPRGLAQRFPAPLRKPCCPTPALDGCRTAHWRSVHPSGRHPEGP